jgi:peptidylprolyl isomerase
MNVKRGDKVAVTYTGKLGNGRVFDRNTAERPLEFIVGEGKLIPGFEQAVEGMAVGDVKTVNIPAAQAYGMRDHSLVRKFPAGVIQGVAGMKKGISVRVKLRNGGSILGTVLELGEDGSIVLDLNHPLAGQDLTFEITLLSLSTPASTPTEVPK